MKTARAVLITEIGLFTTLARRKNSIPLMQELTAELMNRQKTGITTALLNSRASFQDNELKQHVYKKTLQAQCSNLLFNAATSGKVKYSLVSFFLRTQEITLSINLKFWRSRFAFVLSEPDSGFLLRLPSPVLMPAGLIIQFRIKLLMNDFFIIFENAGKGTYISYFKHDAA